MTSRRGFLRGALGLAGTVVLGLTTMGGLASCDAVNPTGNDQPHELDGFLLATVSLGARYDAVIAAVPALAGRLRLIHAAHQAHAEALAGAIGSALPQASPGTDTTPTDRTEALAALVAAEKAARDDAVTACMAASGRLAPLLGSIAAARACHLEVLT